MNVPPEEVAAQAAEAAGSLSVQSMLRDLLAHPRSKAVLEAHLGDLVSSPQLGMAMGLTLEQIAGMAPDVLTPEMLKEIEEALGAL